MVQPVRSSEAQGMDVRLVFSEGRDRILDERHIVWSAGGFVPGSEIVGALQGLFFADLSPLNREELRRRLLFTEIMNPGFPKNCPPDFDGYSSLGARE